jgi:hypothetical protein
MVAAVALDQMALVWVINVALLVKVILAWWMSAVTQQKANEMFTMVGGLSCQPLNPLAPCITFLYPDDGCYARAHEMCRLMGVQGVSSRKVFNYGSLVVQTKNHPSCQVSWGYHVAPTLRVRKSFPTVEEQVIDPALREPREDRRLEAAANRPQLDTGRNRRLRLLPPARTAAQLRRRELLDTIQTLIDFRLSLKARSLQQGPPPYANCPSSVPVGQSSS